MASDAGSDYTDVDENELLAAAEAVECDLPVQSSHFPILASDPLEVLAPTTLKHNRQFKGIRFFGTQIPMSDRFSSPCLPLPLGTYPYGRSPSSGQPRQGQEAVHERFSMPEDVSLADIDRTSSQVDPFDDDELGGVDDFEPALPSDAVLTEEDRVPLIKTVQHYLDTIIENDSAVPYQCTSPIAGGVIPSTIPGFEQALDAAIRRGAATPPPTNSGVTTPFRSPTVTRGSPATPFRSPTATRGGPATPFKSPTPTRRGPANPFTPPSLSLDEKLSRFQSFARSKPSPLHPGAVNLGKSLKANETQCSPMPASYKRKSRIVDSPGQTIIPDFMVGGRKAKYPRYDSSGAMNPFVRPPFPASIFMQPAAPETPTKVAAGGDTAATAPTGILTNNRVIITCFRIGEALRVGFACGRPGARDVLVELYGMSANFLPT